MKRNEPMVSRSWYKLINSSEIDKDCVNHYCDDKVGVYDDYDNNHAGNQNDGNDCGDYVGENGDDAI